jgi:hypothetical protein
MIYETLSDAHLLYRMRRLYISHQVYPAGTYFCSTQGSHEIMTALEATIPDVTPQVCPQVCPRAEHVQHDSAYCVHRTKWRDGSSDSLMIRFRNQYVHTSPVNCPRCKACECSSIAHRMGSICSTIADPRLPFPPQP